MASSGDFGSLRHLAGRFAGSLLPAGPPGADERWACGHLLPGERALWQRMSGSDRRHAVGVARRAVADLGAPSGETDVAREVIAAALLHDVGKIEAGIGTWARAGVTVAAMAVGRERLVAWSSRARAGRSEAKAGGRPWLRWGPAGGSAWRHRIGLYLGHDRVGADLLSRAGSDPFTVAWAGEHHLRPAGWSVDYRLGEALKVADGD